MFSGLSGLSACAIFLVVSGILSAQNNLSLTGTVEDAYETPVAGVSILLISQERVRQAKSEADGSFAFHQIPAGPYEVEITAPGFAKQRTSFNLRDHTTQSPLSITLRIGSQPNEELCGSHAFVTYGPLGGASSQLSGSVQDYVHGKASRNAEVILRKNGDSQAAFQVHSDASGRFRFENLPAGRYDLRIAKPGYWPVDIQQLVKPRENALTIHAAILQQSAMIACQ